MKNLTNANITEIINYCSTHNILQSNSSFIKQLREFQNKLPTMQIYMLNSEEQLELLLVLIQNNVTLKELLEYLEVSAHLISLFNDTELENLNIKTKDILKIIYQEPSYVEELYKGVRDLTVRISLYRNTFELKFLQSPIKKLMYQVPQYATIILELFFLLHEENLLSQILHSQLEVKPTVQEALVNFCENRNKKFLPLIYACFSYLCEKGNLTNEAVQQVLDNPKNALFFAENNKSQMLWQFLDKKNWKTIRAFNQAKNLTSLYKQAIRTNVGDVEVKCKLAQMPLEIFSNICFFSVTDKNSKPEFNPETIDHIVRSVLTTNKR